jgi:hypothetical protein
MKQAVLWLAALVVPLLWGYVVYWLMERLWPPRSTSARMPGEASTGRVGGEHIHYEI